MIKTELHWPVKLFINSTEYFLFGEDYTENCSEISQQIYAITMNWAN